MPSIATLTLNPALDVSTATEVVRPTEKLRCTSPTYEAGGGGINVARVVHELGGAAVAIFPAGGAPGERLKRLLEQEGLESDIVEVAGWTRESLTVDERVSGEQYRFVLPGPQMDLDEARRCLERLGGHGEFPRFVVASGSIPPGVPGDFYDKLSKQCERLGAALIIDASGEALRSVTGGEIRLLKPNLSEAEILLGRCIEGEADEERATRELIDRGFCRTAVLSLGARGAVACDGVIVKRFPPIDVPIRSAVGAGDSMVAAIVLGLSRDWPFFEAVRFGIAAGAAAVMTSGTQLARRDDVERLFGHVDDHRSATT